MNASQVDAQVREIAADQQMPADLAAGILCSALPIVVPMLRKLADAAADGVFWPVRFIVRGALNGLVDALEDWGQDVCGEVPDPLE